MKQSLKSTRVAQALLVATACFASFGMASVTINYEAGQITSSGTNVSAGTLLFISHGVDGVFNSSSWTIDSNSFLVGDDKLIKAVEINDGVASGAINGFDLISGAGANSKFTGLFIQGITSTELDYVTALLVGSRKFSTTGDTQHATSRDAQQLNTYGP